MVVALLKIICLATSTVSCGYFTGDYLTQSSLKWLLTEDVSFGNPEVSSRIDASLYGFSGKRNINLYSVVSKFTSFRLIILSFYINACFPARSVETCKCHGPNGWKHKHHILHQAAETLDMNQLNKIEIRTYGR